MSVGSDNNKLFIPRAVVPGISVDPRIPELTATSSSPRKRVTCANVKMALTASQIALSKFIDIRSPLHSPRRNTRVWDRIKAEYDECTGCIAEDGDSAADSLPILKAKYGYCYSVYERCRAQIADMIAQAVGCLRAIPRISPEILCDGCPLGICLRSFIETIQG